MADLGTDHQKEHMRRGLRANTRGRLAPLLCCAAATQVLLENYLMLAAAIQNQNAGRLPDMLRWVVLRRRWRRTNVPRGMSALSQGALCVCAPCGGLP